MLTVSGQHRSMNVDINRVTGIVIKKLLHNAAVGALVIIPATALLGFCRVALPASMTPLINRTLLALIYLAISYLTVYSIFAVINFYLLAKHLPRINSGNSAPPSQ